MNTLLLALFFATPPWPVVGRSAPPIAHEVLDVCPTGGDWLLVYRYTVNVQEEPFGAPIYETREMFDGQRFPTEDAAYCGARKVRRDGIPLPGLARFGRDSNVMPESITPMPHLLAEGMGIQPAHPVGR